MFVKKRKVILWSDNCTGQHKNIIFLILLIYLVATGVFEQIGHKYLVSDHSCVASDRDFAQIEKRKRLSKCFIPDDVENMIFSARHKNPNFKNFT